METGSGALAEPRRRRRYHVYTIMTRLTSLFCTLALTLVFAAGNDADWPYWRGPDANGVARGDAPLRWSDTEHVAWKAQVPGRGMSSPVLWGDKIFLTTAVPTGKPPAAATEPVAPQPPPPPGGPGGRRGGPGGFRGGGGPQAEQKFMLLCLDRKTGKQLWEKTARVATPHEGFHSKYGSFASNSPVTDGKHVIAFFGSRGVYAYTMDGELAWEKDFGVKMRITMSFGEGSWPALDGKYLVLQFDHEGDSFVVALDKNTGKELWRANRPAGVSWAGPLITSHAGRKQVIVSATKKVCAYDLETGKQLWEAMGLGGNAIPAPVAADGMAFVMTGFRSPNMLAIKLGKDGDLTGTDNIVWQNQRGNSYTPSPVLAGGKLYFLTDSGMLSCFDAKTGKPFYSQQRLPKPYNFKASPVAANGKLYLASEDGDVIVVKMGEQFEVLATNTLEGQMFVATPAVTNGEIFLRGQNTLFCIR